MKAVLLNLSYEASCTNLRETSATTELLSLCHWQQNFYNASMSNITSPQAPNITAILLLKVILLPIVELKSFRRTLSAVSGYFPKAEVSTCHVTSAFTTLLLQIWRQQSNMQEVWRNGN